MTGQLCPHCGIPTIVEPVTKATAEATRQPQAAGKDAEKCPSCEWWCCPPREVGSDHHQARTGGMVSSWLP